jgi:hypothetical protein
MMEVPAIQTRIKKTDEALRDLAELERVLGNFKAQI